MKIEFVLIADSVENVNGKLYTMGAGWTNFRSASYPAVARLGIVVSLLIDPGETPDGKQVDIKIGGKTSAQPLTLQFAARIASPKDQVPSDKMRQRVFVALNLNLPLPQPGVYQIEATSGGQTKNVEFEAITSQS